MSKGLYGHRPPKNSDRRSERVLTVNAEGNAVRYKEVRVDPGRNTEASYYVPREVGRHKVYVPRTINDTLNTSDIEGLVRKFLSG